MEIKQKLDEMGTAFEAFKKANDASLAEIKAKGYASAETTEKVEKLNNQITALEQKIDALAAAANRTKAGGELKDEAKEKAAEYKEAVLSFMRKGKEIPQELAQMAKKSMSVDSDDDGGFLVTPEMSSEIVEKVFESSPVRQLASVQTISSNALDMIEDLDEAASGWVGETQARAATSTPTIKKIQIPVHELYSFPFATQQLLDDAAVNLEAWLSGKVSAKFARDEATAFISGNGVLKPKGILSYASGTSFGQVERQEGLATTAIEGNDLISVQALLKEPYQNNASWLMNRLVVAAIRKLKDVTSGQYIWQPGLSLATPAQLLGRPVYYAADLPTGLTQNVDTIIYGDIKAGYQVVDRVGIRVLRDPFTNKGFVGFYTTKRVGGAVKNFEAIKIWKTKTS